MPAIDNRFNMDRIIKILTVALVIAALIICLTPKIGVKADTLSVWKTADDGSEGTLRWAVNNAVSNDIISFDTNQISPGSIIVIDEQIVIDKNLTIIGPGADYLTISGDNKDRVFDIKTDSEVCISGLRISDGRGAWGGGINNSGDLYLEYCIIENNLSAFEGGGIYNDGDLEIDHSTITNNRTEDNEYWAGDGAGIYSSDGTDVIIRYSTISSNICGDHIGDNAGSGGNGGGIYGLTQALINLTNCTISGNSTGDSSSPDGRAGRGGGIYNVGVVRLSNCTIANNQAGSDPSLQGRGGGIWSYGTLDGGHAAVDARNSIIADNTAAEGPNLYGGVLWSKGCNLIGDEFDGWVYYTGSITDGDQLGVDPRLDVLADNGGFTQTHALLSGSLAIDGVIEGWCYTTSWSPVPVTDDQRGVPRPRDGDGDGLALCDIGAYECKCASITINLAAGWNTFSVPLDISPDNNTLGNLATMAGFEIGIAYYLDGTTQTWGLVGTDYVMLPCDAIYIYMNAAGSVPLYTNPNPTVPAKSLYTGWNLAGSAFINTADELAVDEALISLYYGEGKLLPLGYSQVISPELNQPGWVYLRDGVDPPNMLLGKGYLVAIDNTDEYLGQTYTPWPWLSRPIVVDISCDEFTENPHGLSDEFQVEICDKITVKLCSNPSTGSIWDYETTIENVLIEEDYYFERPEGSPPGAPGTEVWTFKAVKKGTTEVQMEYGQPWEGGSKAVRTYTMIVIVE